MSARQSPRLAAATRSWQATTDSAPSQRPPRPNSLGTAHDPIAAARAAAEMPPPSAGTRRGIPRHPAPFVHTSGSSGHKGEPSPAVPVQKAPRLFTGGPLGLFPPTPTGPVTPSPGVNPLIGVTPNGSAPMNFVPPMSPITPSTLGTPTPKTGSSARSTRSNLSRGSSTAQGSASGQSKSGQSTAEPPKKKKKKQKRKRFSEQQVAILEAQLKVNNTPSAKRLYELADELNDPEVCKDQVKVWFQNRRQKMKKLRLAEEARLKAEKEKSNGNGTPRRTPRGTPRGSGTPRGGAKDTPRGSDSKRKGSSLSGGQSKKAKK